MTLGLIGRDVGVPPGDRGRVVGDRLKDGQQNVMFGVCYTMLKPNEPTYKDTLNEPSA